MVVPASAVVPQRNTNALLTPFTLAIITCAGHAQGVSKGMKRIAWAVHSVIRIFIRHERITSFFQGL